MGAAVVGSAVGTSVGANVGMVGAFVGANVGMVGALVGASVGAQVSEGVALHVPNSESHSQPVYTSHSDFVDGHPSSQFKF